MSHLTDTITHGAEILAEKGKNLAHKVVGKFHHQDTGPDPHAEQESFGYEAARNSSLGVPIDRHQQ